jgi:hypothetical protein
VNKKKTISCLAMEPLVCAINTDWDLRSLVPSMPEQCLVLEVGICYTKIVLFDNWDK